MRTKSGNVPDYEKKLLTISRRFYPNVVSFEKYVHMLNESLSTKLQLRHSSDSASYSQLLSSLLVAFPSHPTFPENAMEGLPLRSVSMDDVLTQVISCTLRKHQNGSIRPHQVNVLCNGFFFSKQDGQGSMFRDLDVRGPSASVQQLRKPAFAVLFSRVGYVVLRHVLMYASLLLGVHERGHDSTPTTEAISKTLPSSVLLQICGPISVPNQKRNASSNEDRKHSPTIETDIILKRDVLYRTPPRNPRCQRHENDENVKNRGLPQTNHLQSLPPSCKNAEHLIRIIFPICDKKVKGKKSEKSASYWGGDARDEVRRYDMIARFLLKPTKKKNSFTLGRIPPRLRGMVPIFKQFLGKVQKNCFRRILGRYCPLSAQFRGKETSNVCLLSMYSNPTIVAKYLNACIRKVFPNDLFGSSRNRGVICKAINHFVCRRNEREHFDVRLFISREGFKVCDVPWLHAKGPNGRRTSDPEDLRYRRARITEFVVWILRGFVIPMVNQNFYVTEADRHRYRLFYYRREVWTILHDRAEEKLYEDNQRFETLSKEDLHIYSRQQVSVNSTLGFTGSSMLVYNDIRFVPKKSSLRGIQRPRAKLLSTGLQHLKAAVAKRLCKQKTISVNAAMKDFGRILFHESKGINPSVGAAVFGLDDIYRKILDTKREWIRVGSPDLYACALDIATSFDTIPLKKLFEDVVPHLFVKDRYALLRYKLTKSQYPAGRAVNRYLTHVCSKPGEETSFYSIMRTELARAHPGGLFSDLVRMTTWRKDVICKLLFEALGNNIVITSRRRHRKSQSSRFALQRHGLPQGHPVSQLLTSLFYGSIERNDLSEFLGDPRITGKTDQFGEMTRKVGVEDGHTSKDAVVLLMRLVDDTIFISSSRTQAQQFLQKMIEESRSDFYGFSINKDKAKTNFASPLVPHEPQRFITWCGILLDTKTLEIRGDFFRYNTGVDDRLRNAINIEYDRNPFQKMMEQSRLCFKPKMHPLLFDGQINSHSTVVLNVYQSALLSCLKLCSYTLEIKPTDVGFFISMVNTSASMFANLVNRCTTSFKAKAYKCHLPLPMLELRYICLHSYCTGIRKKLLRRNGMHALAEAAMKSLRSRLGGLADTVHARNGTNMIPQLCNRIASQECDCMWQLRL
ncbi:unnamed protein product [Agarophyton chilense]|eukprot:gb/GEZJ01002926.1/.p1 GENE.gb/GEZJ01002926.1/~~gb/GEZJ01002926.1/.p1  ORF type:complete len:1135 (+),score=145.72 gb/GEZJ01002926.1/:105-3509(+)